MILSYTVSHLILTTILSEVDIYTPIFKDQETMAQRD